MSAYKNVSTAQFNNALKTVDNGTQLDTLAFYALKSLNSGNLDPLRVVMGLPFFRHKTTNKLIAQGVIMNAYIRFHGKAIVRQKVAGVFELKANRGQIDLNSLPSVLDWYQRPVESAPEKKKTITAKQVAGRLEWLRDNASDMAALKSKGEQLDLLDLLSAAYAAVEAAISQKTDPVCSVAQDTLSRTTNTTKEKSAGYKIPA